MVNKRREEKERWNGGQKERGDGGRERVKGRTE
jgi:hypothetical protein